MVRLVGGDMVEHTDRIALAVKDRKEAAKTYERFFDAKVIDDVDDKLLGARRLTMQWGRDIIELLEPTGDSGPVGEFLREGKRGVFFGGYSLAEPAKLAAHLENQGIKVHEQGADRFVVLPRDIYGTGLILSKSVERERVGLMDSIFQVTYVVKNQLEAKEKYTKIFKLEDRYTRFVASQRYGYMQCNIWLDPQFKNTKTDGRIDGIEILEGVPYKDPVNSRLGPDNIEESQAVVRFTERNGEGIYLICVITDDAREIIQRIMPSSQRPLDHAFRDFIHPRHLHGLFLMITTYDVWNQPKPPQPIQIRL